MCNPHSPMAENIKLIYFWHVCNKKWQSCIHQLCDVDLYMVTSEQYTEHTFKMRYSGPYISQHFLILIKLGQYALACVCAHTAINF